MARIVGNISWGWKGLVYPTLRWRHNEPHGVLNHRPLDCLLNRLFICRSKKTLKLCVTGLCEGNSPVTGEFPAHRASNAENVSIGWRHHDMAHACYCSDDTRSHAIRAMPFIFFLPISRGHFYPNHSRKSHSSLIGASYGYLSWVWNLHSRSFAFEVVVLNAMSCYIVPRYIESLEYSSLSTRSVNNNYHFYKHKIAPTLTNSLDCSLSEW